jgi:hypothetical protein
MVLSKPCYLYFNSFPILCNKLPALPVQAPGHCFSALTGGRFDGRRDTEPGEIGGGGQGGIQVGRRQQVVGLFIGWPTAAYRWAEEVEDLNNTIRPASKIPVPLHQQTISLK